MLFITLVDFWQSAREEQSSPHRTVRRTIVTSDDGINWQSRQLPILDNLFGIAWCEGFFVAVGQSDSSVILTSTDAISWDRSISPFFKDIAYGEGKVVCVGYTDSVYTSTDGDSWKGHPLDSGLTNLYSVIWADGRFVAVGHPGLILTSDDGVSWKTQTPPTSATLILDITYGNGQYLAVSGYWRDTKILSSSNAILWTSRDSGLPNGNGLETVVWGNNKFVAAGIDGAIAESPDGNSWTSLTSGKAEALSAVAWGAGIFVAVGNGDSAVILTSSNGIDWTEQLLARDTVISIDDVIWAVDRFVAVGWHNVKQLSTILTSFDGITWTKQTSGTDQALSNVAWGNSKFVALAGYDTILVSNNGTTWSKHTTEILGNMGDIVWANDQFVIVGDSAGRDGTIHTSNDGTVWVGQITESIRPLFGVAWGNGQWVSVGQGGTILNTGTPGGVVRTPRFATDHLRVTGGGEMLRYEIPASGIISMKIHDVQGRLAGSLKSEWKEAGTHRWRIPSTLSQGVNVVSLSNGGTKTRRKFVVTR